MASNPNTINPLHSENNLIDLRKFQMFFLGFEILIQKQAKKYNQKSFHSAEIQSFLTLESTVIEIQKIFVRFQVEFSMTVLQKMVSLYCEFYQERETCLAKGEAFDSKELLNELFEKLRFFQKTEKQQEKAKVQLQIELDRKKTHEDKLKKDNILSLKLNRTHAVAIRPDAPASFFKEDSILEDGGLADCIRAQEVEKKDPKMAIALYWRSVQAGNALAAYNLAYMFDNGKGIERDAEAATELYEKAALRGLSAGKWNYGCRLFQGLGVERNYDAAAYWIQQAALEGVTNAEGQFAILLEGGYGLLKNMPMAIHWYQHAAYKGEPYSLCRLAEFISDGTIVQEDPTKVIAELYRQAAEKGNKKALFKYAEILETGKGIQQDVKAAIEWYRLSAEQDNNEEAKLKFVILVEEHAFIDLRERANIDWYRLAAESGHVLSQLAYATKLEDGFTWVNTKKALELYYALANYGDSTANEKFCELLRKFDLHIQLIHLGDCKGRSPGMEKIIGKEFLRICVAAKKEPHIQVLVEDQLISMLKAAKISIDELQNYPEIAFQLAKRMDKSQSRNRDINLIMQLYLSAAERGHVRSQFLYGMLVLQTFDNNNVAINWLQKAADNHFVQAQFNLGLIYEQGKIVKLNYVLAHKWYLKAAKRGCAPAQNNLACLIENGLGVLQNINSAIDWYLLAVKNKSVEAEHNLAVLFMKGKDVPQDLIKAKIYCQSAADKGNHQARECLKQLNNLKVPSDPKDNHKNNFTLTVQFDQTKATTSKPSSLKLPALKLPSLKVVLSAVQKLF